MAVVARSGGDQVGRAGDLAGRAKQRDVHRCSSHFLPPAHDQARSSVSRLACSVPTSGEPRFRHETCS
jgi:hypothetical protein